MRKERSKPRAHFDSGSVSWPKISLICTFPRGNRAGAKFQSFTRAAVGALPTKTLTRNTYGTRNIEQLSKCFPSQTPREEIQNCVAF